MITIEKVPELHKLSIEKYGGSMGIRDEGYLQSGIERPFATFAGQELHPHSFQKAAAILESIIKNHPFVDGNKRTEFLACGGVLLEDNWEIIVTEDESYAYVIEVTSSHVEFDEIVSWIQDHSENI